MNEIVNMVLLVDDKFIPEMHLRYLIKYQYLLIVHVDDLLKIKKELKNLKK